MLKIVCAGALALLLTGCGFGAVATLAPGEAIVAREAGYDSYFEKGLDYVAEQLCANPERDPVTGNCE